MKNCSWCDKSFDSYEENYEHIKNKHAFELKNLLFKSLTYKNRVESHIDLLKEFYNDENIEWILKNINNEFMKDTSIENIRFDDI